MTADAPTLPALDVPAVADRARQLADTAADALLHMDTSLALAEAQLAVVRHHQTHRLAHDLAAG